MFFVVTKHRFVRHKGNMEQVDDFICIDRVLQGQQKAFGLLVEKYQDMVFTIAFRILQQREEAEDVAQQVFVKAFQKLNSFQRTAQFSTWLFRIAYNTAISAQRKHAGASSIKTIELNEDIRLADDGDSYLILENSLQQLENAIENLPVHDRGLISLYYLQQQSVDEICEVTGLSASNVKIRLFRIRKKLQEMLLNNDIKSETRLSVLL